jgi:Uma2 family endonuclease
LIFVANEHLDRVTREQLNGPADLVIEVISEGSVYNDRVDKFQEYEEGGVREYWLIDSRPKRQRADFYVLDDQGHYQPVPIGKDGIYHSTVLPNFWLRVAWLWETEPDALAALDELVGTEAIVAAMRARRS